MHAKLLLPGGAMAMGESSNRLLARANPQMEIARGNYVEAVGFSPDLYPLRLYFCVFDSDFLL